MFYNVYEWQKPFCEVLNSPGEFRQCFTDESLRRQVSERSELSTTLSHAKTAAFLAATQRLVESAPDDRYARILLYVPLEYLPQAPESYKDFYRSKMPALVRQEDERRDFAFGDSSPAANAHEKIVKVVHLLPWLRKSDIVDDAYLDELLDNALIRAERGETAMASSFIDVAQLPSNCLSLDGTKLTQLQSAVAKRKKSREQKNYRLAWLALDDPSNDVRLTNVTGPFFDNIDDRRMQFIALQQQFAMERGDMVLLNGPKLKGYAARGNDYYGSIFDSRTGQIVKHGKKLTRKTERAHHVISSVWLGESNTREAQLSAVNSFFEIKDEATLTDCIKDLERDLLQYGLMHEGFPNAYGAKLSQKTANFAAIDGASAFWDSRYRHAATMLYAKYVFIPQK